MPSDLTAERLRELLSYNPETGEFRWRIDLRRARAGSLAGCKNSHGYLAISIGYRKYTAHRLAWLYVHGTWPEQIDHINRVRHDNRLCNLRSASPSQNQHNKAAYANNRTGLKGAFPTSSGYIARICAAGKRRYLGYFGTAEEAHAAYCKAAAELHGEFARTR